MVIAVELSVVHVIIAEAGFKERLSVMQETLIPYSGREVATLCSTVTL